MEISAMQASNGCIQWCS